MTRAAAGTMPHMDIPRLNCESCVKSYIEAFSTYISAGSIVSRVVIQMQHLLGRTQVWIAL
jgi:hypothetical protein